MKQKMKLMARTHLMKPLSILKSTPTGRTKHMAMKPSDRKDRKHGK